MSTPNWRISLEDSVLGLRFAADEYRSALRLAQSGRWSVNTIRLKELPGAISLRDAGAQLRGSDDTLRPYDRAVVEIGELFTLLVHDLQDAYERAALLYAYGATWAVEQIALGRTPASVEVRTDAAGRPVPGPRPEIRGHLERMAGLGDLEDALIDLIACEDARAYGNELAKLPSLGDHEAGAMHKALDKARGIGNAAHLFGVQAERALQYALNVLAKERQPQPESGRA
ncbi:hypothetical protein [Nonomuraea sp. NPDC049758]|uniref:hypothetical protein n=1 Tax=Nonomuraea sp. NPDC049758 TaxID=3154360 RepID=UPI003436559A